MTIGKEVSVNVCCELEIASAYPQLFGLAYTPVNAYNGVYNASTTWGDIKSTNIKQTLRIQFHGRIDGGGS